MPPTGCLPCCVTSGSSIAHTQNAKSKPLAPDRSLWLRTGETSGKEYVSLRLAAPAIAGFLYSLTDERAVTPHVAQNDTNRRSATDGRTTRHSGYAVSMQI